MPQDSVRFALKTQIEIIRRVDDQEVRDKTLIYHNETVISPHTFYAGIGNHGMLKLVIEALQRSVMDSNILREAYEKALTMIERDM